MGIKKYLLIIGLFLATSLDIFGQGIVFFDPAEGTRQVKWNPSGTLIATANPDGKVWIWDTNGQLLASFVADPLGVYTIDWHPNGTRLASNGTDLFVKIWNVTDLNNVTLSSSFSLTTETTAYTEGLFELLWHPDGIQLLTLGLNQAHAWDSLAGQPINSLPAPAAYDMEVSPDHTQLAMIIGFFQLHIIGVNDFSTNIWMRPLDETSIMRISWSPDIVNPTIASGDVTGHVRLWNLGNRTISDVLVSIPSVIQDILWSPDGNRLVIATNSGHLYTVDAQTGEILGTITANGPILYADWQPDGNEVVYVAYDGDSDPTNDLQIIVPPDVIACDLTIPASDTTALISAITSANNAGTPQTLCLTSSTYTLSAVDNTTDGANGLPSIVGEITIVGNGATIIFESGSGFAVAGEGRLTLLHLTVISDNGG